MLYSDCIPEEIMTVVALLNWNYPITIYEFDNFNPDYLNIDKSDENGWKIYADKVRDIMSECLDIPQVNFGYRHWKEFIELFNIELRKV